MAPDKEKQREKTNARDQGKEHEKRAEHEGQSRSSDRKSSDRGSNERTSKDQSKSNRDTKRSASKLSAGESAKTTDHDVIRHWIEERGGQPATVKATEGKKDPGLLRIDFPGRGAENRLDPISWEDFFDKFEEKQLAFLYQEETRTGRVSRFSKFVSRGDGEGKGQSKR